MTTCISELENNFRATNSFFGTAWVRSMVAIICTFGLANVAFASGFAGKYTSAAKCSMTVEALDVERGMSEGYFYVVSKGDGTCPWQGVGVAKTTHVVVGALVSLSAALSFGDLNWAFGPGGDQVDITFFDTEGKQIFKQTFTRVK